MRICTRHITGPGAWVGADIKESDWLVTLGSAEREELLAATRALPPGAGPGEVTAADFPLPRLAPTLAELVRELEFGRGFAVLRGVPTDLPEPELYRLYAGLVAHMGTAVSQNARGELISHVTDYGKGDLSDNSVRIYETNAVVPFHTDSSDITGLLCLRPAAEGGASLLASSATIHNRLLERHRELLGVYYSGFVYDRRTEEESGETPYYRNPVFGYFDDVLSCRYYIRHYIDSAQQKSGLPLTEVETLALDLFEEIAETESNQVRMELRIGDLQFVNNNIVVHARTAYRDGPDQRRDLLRIWFNTPYARKMPAWFAKFRFGMPRVEKRA